MGTQFRWSFFMYAAAMALIVLSLSHSSMVVSGAYYKKIQVVLYNMLEPGKNLHVHCKSKDDDLGDHVIGYYQNYTWSFHDNLFSSTLFWCRMDWTRTGGSTVSGSFEIYHAKRDLYRCSSFCAWGIREDGLFVFNRDTGEWDYFFGWPSNSKGAGMKP
uniref:S-protein homolog n=1 Tax=Nelumbo nucifera TaxID=4432 RepID=A0A822XZA6_NELNU|nr:TPA_asm: hypothetical protein HUJ06_026015 [Nelumbo nucifera]